MGGNLNGRSDLYFISIAALILSIADGYTPVDPYEAFRTADSILTSSGGYSYQFRYSGTGSQVNIIPAVLGSANLSWPRESRHPLMILSFDSTENEDGSGPFPVPSSYAASADSLYRFDHALGTMTSAPASPEGASIFDFPPSAVMMELVLPHPFADELSADSIAVLQPDTIEGEPCHAYLVYYRGGETTAVWNLSMNDFLPRAVIRAGSTGGEMLEIWNLHRTGRLPDPGDEAPEVFLADRNGFVCRLGFPRERHTLLLFFTSGGSNSLSALGSVTEYPSDLMDVYGISVMEQADISHRLEGLDISVPILVHGEGAAEDYGVDLLPAAVLISPSGRVVITATGLNEIRSQYFTDHFPNN